MFGIIDPPDVQSPGEEDLHMSDINIYNPAGI